MNIGMVVALLGGLGLFLYGMTVMSDALQRVAGDKLRSFLRHLTQNRILGAITGVAIAALMQSSSAATVMLVGFVSAGLLDLVAAVSVVIGANIGATATGWIVALVGFKVDISQLALPAIALGFFARFLGKPRLSEWGRVLLGFGLLFLGLEFMGDAVHTLHENPAISEWMAKVQVTGMGSLVIAIVIGAVVTMVIQASSAAMTMTMVLASQGLIDFPTAAALVIGQNIGTTITANLAAIGASKAARQTAISHFLFNLFGAVWIGLFFWLLLPLLDAAIPGAVPPTAGADTKALPDHIAAFNTFFNLANAIVFLPFTQFIAWAARKLVKDDPLQGEPEKRLRFAHSDLAANPHIAVEEAREALHNMGKMAVDGFDVAISLLAPGIDEATFEERALEIEKAEQALDEAEDDLRQFTVDLIEVGLPHELSEEINHISGSAHDYERVGDHLDSMLRQIRRKRSKDLHFSDEAHKDFDQLANYVRENLVRVTANISNPWSSMMSEATATEEMIDVRRAELRKKHINRLRDQACSLQAGIVFIELLTSLERIGDHAFNVAQDFDPREA